MDSLLDAIQLENLEKENFDKSLAKRHIHQYFPCQNFVLYGITFTLIVLYFEYTSM